MAVKLLFNRIPTFIDSAGDPLDGGLLFTYAAGSSTKQATYTTSVGDVAHSNPIVLDSRGEPTSGAVWGTTGETYKLVLAPSTDTDPPTAAIWTIDNVSPINDTTVTIDEWVSGPAPTFIGTTSFSLVGDQTTTFHVGRRLKTTNTGGTIYSVITVSAFTTLTTITVVNDSGVLDSGLSAVSYGLLSEVNPSLNHVTLSTAQTVSGAKTHSGTVSMSSKSMYWAKGADIVSAATLVLGADGNYFDVTGSTGPVTAITVPAGTLFMLQFDSTPTLTHHATNLDLPSEANITAVAGDSLIGFATAANQVHVISYTKAAGTQIASVTQTQMADNAIGQAELKDATATNSLALPAGVSSTLGLTGGDYAMWTASADSLSSDLIGFGHTNTASGLIGVICTTATTFFTDERYFTASPPYNLGNGDIPMFILLTIDSGGNIVEISVAPDPPWAFKGPTIITPTHTINGKQFRRVATINNKNLHNISHSDPDMIKFMQGNVPIVHKDIEITQAVKNADMNLIPHPWFRNNRSGVTTVLLDPVGSLVNRFFDIYLNSNAREVFNIIHTGKITIGNTDIGANSPQGVMPVSVKWKLTP